MKLAQFCLGGTPRLGLLTKNGLIDATAAFSQKAPHTMFAPVGPYLTTADEVDPQSLNIECRVNGELRQSANTRDMLFSCADLVSYISQFMTLKPGDLIFTGTPAGVILGMPQEKQQWLKPGDKIEVTIETLGSLLNILS
ncbi:MAG: fumarylacetoacetate hydrolase family protein [Oscillospiraceae bacterium]|jgi:2-keto-4-pentenoate hydratase/2-oxohepta-3-ene-1,7-dioic acid hydratase in catechol pathway|nr:fumarylacetoacetate hydrolase family protein [Oscillospiraceae bacterium]